METNEKEITFSEFKEYLKNEEEYIIVEAKYVKDMTFHVTNLTCVLFGVECVVSYTTITVRRLGLFICPRQPRRPRGCRM